MRLPWMVPTPCGALLIITMEETFVITPSRSHRSRMMAIGPSFRVTGMGHSVLIHLSDARRVSTLSLWICSAQEILLQQEVVAAAAVAQWSLRWPLQWPHCLTPRRA